jgi:hypothetical protein
MTEPGTGEHRPDTSPQPRGKRWVPEEILAHCLALGFVVLALLEMV